MATKSHAFKSESERAAWAAKNGGGKPKAKPKAKTTPPTNGAARVSKHAAKRGVYALETSEGARPSRKSTRKSNLHIKNDTPLTLRSMSKAAAPGRVHGSRRG